MNYNNRYGLLLFRCAYALCVLDGMLFGLSTFGQLRHAEVLSWALRGASAAVVLLKLVMDRRYNRYTLAYVIGAGMLLTIVFLKSGYNHVFSLLIIALGVRGTDMERNISFDFWLRAGIIVFVIICSLTGIIENYVTYRTGTQEYRYSLGFSHPNTLASLIMGLVLEEAYLERRKANIIYTVMLWIVGVIMYAVTLNRTSVIIILLFPLVLLLINISKRPNIRRSSLIICAALFPVAIAVSFATMKLCENSALFGLLDRFMSNRFTNAAVLYERYGVPLLGQRVTLISIKIARSMNSNIALLDVAYLRTLIQAGPLVLALMGAMYICAVKSAVIEKNRHMLIALCSFVVFGVSESGYNNVCMNYTLLMMAAAPFMFTDGMYADMEELPDMDDVPEEDV